MGRAASWLATASPRKVLLATLALAALVEGATVVARFGLGLESTRDTAFIGYLTFGIRIHHGYIGALLLLIAWLRPEPPQWRSVTVIIGGALLVSDLVHHFLVLWPITGSPHFDLTYGPTGEGPEG